MVLYFSGTGNSKLIAKHIAAKTGKSLYSINDGIKHSAYPEVNTDTVIFSVPTYAWRIPSIVRNWIKGCAAFSGKKVYFLLTCGGDTGNAEKYVKQLCAQHSMAFMGCAEILMPENYIAMFDCPSEEESLQITEAAEYQATALAATICSGEKIPSKKISFLDHLKSGIVNDCFYTFSISSKKFQVSGDCIGCGKCEILCPMNNIRIQNGHPVWGKDCTHCMACICHCPAEAIEYGRVTQGKRRYRCPK